MSNMTNDEYRKSRGTNKPFTGSEEQAKTIWTETILHRFDADAKLPCDLLVGLALGNQLQHFHFARTQAGLLLDRSAPLRRLQRKTVQSGGDGRAEECVSFLNLPDCPTQDIGGRLFDQISRRTQEDHLPDVLVIPMRREDQHPGGGDVLHDSPSGFQAVEQRHRNIHDDHVGTELLRQLDRMAAGFRLSDHLDIAFRLQQGPKSLSDDLMVIRQQHSDSLHKHQSL